MTAPRQTLESPGGLAGQSLSVQRLVRALHDLFRNPMPHDLIAIRREVEREYGGDEEAAKGEMDAWCSQQYMEHQITAHREAWHNAAEVLREHGQPERVTMLWISTTPQISDERRPINTLHRQ